MEQRPTVFSAGRLSPEKGFDLLIEAHARLRAEGHAHELLILGEGGERASLEALMNEHPALCRAETIEYPYVTAAYRARRLPRASDPESRS